LPIARTIGIHGHLEVPKQAGRILHFVNDDRRRVTLEETAWLLFGLFSFGREVQGYERIVWKKAQEGRGFAGLSGSGQHNHWPRLRRALQPGFDSARNPHLRNMRYNRIFCIVCLERSLLPTMPLRRIHWISLNAL
jgi:hypothetical protein